MDYSVVLMYQPGDVSWKFYEEITRAVASSLAALGYDVGLRYREIPKNTPSIIFALQDVPEIAVEDIPKGSIIYNLEQIIEGSRGLDPAYVEKMRHFEVWDYSARNVEKLKQMFGIEKARHVPLGYAPVLDRLRQDIPKDIDVLFYGWINERRKKIIDQLKERGLNVVASQSLFTKERDFMVARSKVVLNMHFYTPGIMEVVRIHDLLANHKAVVCECGPDTELHAGYENTCLFAPYEGLVDAVMSLVTDEKALKEQEDKGFAAFSRMRYEDILANFVGRKGGQGHVSMAVPDTLNAGSGNDFLIECLNIDAHNWHQPDIVMDMAGELSFEQVFQTERFGSITMKPGMFKKIYGHDIVEQSRDLPRTMKNFLDLLAEGGRLELCVPYELATATWGNARHTRGFNEESWSTFTDSAWLMGWQDYRFHLERMEFKLSRLGRRLRRFLFLKKDSRLLRCVPRAVESMSLTLVKVPATAQDRLDYMKENGTFYKRTPQQDGVTHS